MIRSCVISIKSETLRSHTLLLFSFLYLVDYSILQNRKLGKQSFRIPVYLSTKSKSWVRFSFKYPPAANTNDNFSDEAKTSNQGAEQSATTTFISDAIVVTAQPQEERSVNSLFYSSSSDHYVQDIKAFMAKPTILLTGTFASTDVHGSIYETTMPQAALTSNVYKNKLSGYLGFRATQVFKLVVNANPMQQGRYIMYAVHLGGVATPSALSHALACSNTIVQRTQLPHVEIDIACDTECTLKIPYVSSLNYFPLSALTNGSGVGSICRLGVSPYVALTTGLGSTTAGFTLWTHFEDVELIGPATPQSGNVFGSSKKRLSNSEEERGSNQPLSSSLIRISKAASLFNDVPMLSAYSQSVSWVSDILGKAAYSFGWSSPNQIAPADRVTRSIMPYAGNVDGMDQSQPLSMLTKASVGMAAGFSGTDIDELDFLHLAQIPAHRNFVPWTTAGVAGADLFSLFVSPVTSPASRVANALTYFDYIPAAFVCKYFNYWRGSVVFKFKLVKTQYHSGRLLVAFQPLSTINGTPAGPTLADTDYIHREIIDIRDCNEFTFIVPYLSNMPYCTTDNTKLSCHIGRVVMKILDPLVGPDTVSSTVTIIHELSMGPDFEVAYPSATTLTAGMDLTPQSGNVFGSDPCEIAQTVIGSGGPIKPDMAMNAEFCIGEKIKSFRQLLRFSQPLFARLVGQVGVANLAILPYATTIVRNQAIPDLPGHLSDLYSTLSSCYCLSRGGVRLKISTANTDTSVYTDVAYLNDTLAGGSSTIMYSVALTNSNVRSLVPYCIERHDNPVMEIQVPQYHRYISRITSETTASATYTYATGDAGFAPNVGVVFSTGCQTPATNLKSYTVFRSMGDDGNFGIFRSIPPMTALLTGVFAS